MNFKLTLEQSCYQQKPRMFLKSNRHTCVALNYPPWNKNLHFCFLKTNTPLYLLRPGVLSSRARRGGEYSLHENSKGFKILSRGWKREEYVPAALYSRTCGSVFSSSKNYTSLLYFNKDSAAGRGFTSGFRRWVQHPLQLWPNTPLHPSLRLAFILRTLPASVFLDREGRGKSLSRVANMSVAAGSSIYQTSFVSWNNEESFSSAEISCHKLLFLLFPWRIKLGIVEISMISCSYLLERPVMLRTFLSSQSFT